MFYTRNIYRGKKKNRPVVDYPIDSKNLYDLDKDLSKLIKILPQRNNSNSMTAFWMDGICQSFAYITIYTMLGNGLKIKCDDEAQQDIIDKFNKRINTNGDTIEDYIIDSWLDNLVFGFSLWRISPYIISFDDEEMQGPDIQRIPPETITVQRDQITGLRKFIQSVSGVNTFKTKEEFLTGNRRSVSLYGNVTQIAIPDHQKLIIYSSFFRKPPMYNAIPFVTLKYWILAFMRKYSEKVWAPLMMAFVGDSDHYPNGKPEMKTALRDTAQRLVNVKNFSASAFPGNTKVDVQELHSNGEIYLKFFDKMDQQTMFSLFSSIAARESSGVYKGNQIADESTIGFMKGIERKIERDLKRFYVQNVIEGYDDRKIHFIWPELRASTVENMIKVLETGVKSGIFVDTEERRRAFSQAMPFLSERPITKEESSKMNKEMITMMAPSQPGETSVNAAKDKSKSKSKR